METEQVDSENIEEEVIQGNLENSGNSKNVSAEDNSSCKSVKSTAVVKYSAVQSPANFALLQCNTNLNLPPSNWLSSSAECYGLQYVPSHSSGFSSFRMAHMFPDCVGEVDVVSDAENIKKLLKIPYSKGPVSMMVHCIENTLLIDEFDIHKHLLRTAETEWEWLKKFFFDHILKSLSEKEKALFHKNKSRCALQQKSLASKFLYHSLVVADPNKNEQNACKDESIPHVDTSLPVATAWPPLPEPRIEENLPDPTCNHKFARNVVWTFEDIQMLIGTDMPIFGGTTHPCISLRLRDMSKPINVLTGIDYWLDNLMCNVPEVVMCYHLDGIVQKYELIKTEDLPHLEDSKFSPKLIRDVAQNILSFLKSNATKAGHTYWLFKGKDDDVVKLYDLTSLCTDVLDDKGQNPFTVPVAMLLYRVARNMRQSSDSRRQQGTIRTLLKNCVALLPKEKYPQIVTSAHYMLSDLYIPADIDPASPGLDSEDDESECSTENHSEREDSENLLSTSSSVAVKALCLSVAHEDSPGSNEEAKYSSPPPLSGGVEERCKMALQHVSQGLESLQYIDCTKPEKQKEEEDESPVFDKEEQRKMQQNTEVPKMARPFEAIPMPYSPLPSQQSQEAIDLTSTPCSPGKKSNITFKKKKREKGGANKLKDKVSHKIDEQGKAEKSPKALLCRSKAETMPTWQQPEKADNKTWKQHLKILLYEKACLVYVTHAETEYVAEFYGRSLRYISYVLYCLRILEALNKSTNAGLQSYLLGRAGDCCFMIVQDWARVHIHRHDFIENSTVDQDVLQEVLKDLSSLGIPENNPSEELMPESIDDIEQMLVISCKCYQKALALEPHEQQKSNLRRRLGNIHNELGVLYMNQAAAHYKEKLDGPKQEEDNEYLKKLFMLSLQHLELGVDAFEVVHDEANLALLHSNTGRLMRMCAHFHSPDSSDRRSELAGQEKHFYNKAISSYQKALMILGNRRNNPAIWDTVLWELSTTVFTMATLLQDFPALGSKSQEEAEREVVEYFMKALKYCDLETPGPRFPVYQFRAATIHHRLASLYHKSFRSLAAEDPKKKNLLQLCRLHYEKASKLLSQLEHPAEYLRVQMERVALCEFQAQSATSFSVKLKSLQMALGLILQCQSILKVMLEHAHALRLKEDELIAGKTANDVGQNSFEKKISDNTVLTTCNESVSTDHICDEIKKIKVVEKENQGTSECSDDKSDASKENSEITCDCSSQQDEDLAEQAEECSLVLLLEQRLQFVLRSLAKLCLAKTTNSNSKKDKCENLAQLYKSMYSKTLRKDEDISTTALVSHLLEILIDLDTALLTESDATSSKTR